MDLNKFRERMETESLSAFLVTEPYNRRYLSGFTGSNGILLITQNKLFILTDSRYYQQVKKQAPTWDLVEAGYDLAQGLTEVINKLSLSNVDVGFEADNLTVADFNEWQKKIQEAKLSINLVETTDFVAPLRSVKTTAELNTIRKAVQLADQAMYYAYESVQPGMTEKEVAWNLEVFMRTHGASGVSFEIIVAAGPNSALPHATPSNYKIQAGDIVLIDMGCIADGYCSDLTRTFSLGETNEADFERVWQIVAEAKANAINLIKPGITSIEADAAARDVIKAAGYGDNFGHGLGHGVGLAVHEAPKVSYTCDSLLVKGAVITIEPGIYLPGNFGVRLEDMGVITNQGLEILTEVPQIMTLSR